MFKKYLKLAFCATMIGVSAVACGGDDEKDSDDPINPGEDIDQPADPSELLTPSEAKEFLDKAAIEFMSKIRTSDQKEVITLSHYFADTYGDLEAPDEFDIEAVEGSKPAKAAPARLMADLSAAVAAYDASGIAGAIVTYSYTVGFKQFTGIYEPGMERWIKRGNSDKVIFRFTDEAGRNCELTVTGSSGTYDFDHSYTEEEYGEYVDPETGEPGWGYYDSETSFYVKVPKELTFRLTQSNAELVSGKINTDLSIAAHTLTANVTAKVANIDVTADINGTDDQIEEKASILVSGTKMLTNTAIIKGHDLCNKERIVKLAEQDEISDDDLMSLLTSASATVDAMGKVQVVGVVDFDRSLFKAIRNMDNWNSYEYELRTDAENDVNAAVNALNGKARFVMRFNGNNTNQAKVLWKWDYDNYGNYWWEFNIEPLMQFESDNMTYSFDEYFEVGFSDTEKQWNNLYKNYKKLWESTGR